jgi:hypothetical protein
MTAAQQRKAQRRVPLAAALVLIVYLYAPLEAQLQDAVRFLVVPALVVTGFAMPRTDQRPGRARHRRQLPLPGMITTGRSTCD